MKNFSKTKLTANFFSLFFFFFLLRLHSTLGLFVCGAMKNPLIRAQQSVFGFSQKNRTLSFEEDFLYSAFHTFISRSLDNNNITQLPENMFSGLTSLRSL